MSFKPSTKPSGSRLEVVDLGELGSFKVKTRRPTWDEKCTDEGFSVAGYLREHASARAEQIEHRIRSIIVGWAELVDAEDNPLPFSWGALTALCEQYALVFDQLQSISNRLFRGIGEDAEKNCESPRNDSSADPSTATP